MIAIPVGECVVRNRILLRLVAFWLLLFFPFTSANSALSGPFFRSFDFQNSVIYLKFSDQVSDGCLPDPAAIKDAWEVELRRLGFKVVPSNELRSYGFTVTALGMASGDYTCSVFVESKVSSPVMYIVLPLDDKSYWIEIPLWESEMILSGPKKSMQNRIRDVARDHVNSFFLEISQAKDSAQ